ncbi:hypothetical protein GTCCBUS3UF5_6320 [Geobacillus thermoleovorans CCB_US3_UF5]|uniref:Uncharacterized protein n=2 Tax=Geobacillus thermoleovorans group TaxID=1505648 RepID=U2X7K1_GEOKU|nr:hypothetical protein GTCCBUS3UF5_6320 [Geobacillus thermoleovorans CCB_US3_UF5]GAD14767.1 hypothetical protein GBL_2984 [Geobacillus kaustophilus GBlys]
MTTTLCRDFLYMTIISQRSTNENGALRVHAKRWNVSKRRFPHTL